MKNNTMTDTAPRSPIEQAVMRRVRRIRFLRLIFSNTTLAFAVLVLAVWGIGREVWVARVLQNAPTNIMDLPNFYVAAFRHTRLIVQVLTLSTLASLVYVARESARLVSSVIFGRFTPIG
ncbi:MAG TPA: hypothetical protein VMV38_01825 [Candidatus Paceibacterota bacterium]|nr:hypothetical protein [Candidatus Paceibacterota bacterium]